MQVELVYASEHSVALVELQLEAGTSALDALRRSGLLQRHPEILEQPLKIGIYGRQIEPDTVLQDGDRLEIYRPLRLSPAEARKLAAKGRKGRKGKTGKPSVPRPAA